MRALPSLALAVVVVVWRLFIWSSLRRTADCCFLKAHSCMHHGTIKNRVGVVGPPIHISTAGFVGSSVVTDANPAADVNILVGRVGRPTART